MCLEPDVLANRKIHRNDISEKYSEVPTPISYMTLIWLRREKFAEMTFRKNISEVPTPISYMNLIWLRRGKVCRNDISENVATYSTQYLPRKFFCVDHLSC